MPWSVYSWVLSHNITLPSHGRDSSGPSKAFPRATSTPHRTSRDGSPGPVLVLLPTSGKGAHYLDNELLIYEDLCWTPSAFAETFVSNRMDGEPTANSKLRHCRKVLGAVWLVKTGVPEAVIDKVQAYPKVNMCKRCKPL